MYNIIYKHYEKCYDDHGDVAQGFDWPNQNDLNTRFDVMLDLINLCNHIPDTIKLLDFGCGSSFLYQYILDHHKTDEYGTPIYQTPRMGKGKMLKYTGYDISEKFIEISKKKYPHNQYIKCDILKDDINQMFDYIVANGVFTIKRELTKEQMYDFFTQMILKLFSICNIGLAFNVMSKQVDWERDDLFHLSLDDLAWFLHKNKMRNFIIRNDYGLYEYTVYIYKTPNLRN